MKKTRLFTPGPTPVPDFVRRVMTESLDLHHRHEEFQSVWRRLNERLPRVWNAPPPVVMVFGSGTAGMDAVVANLFEPGEKVLVGSIGKFGDRWLTIAQRRGLQVVAVKKSWGEALHPLDLQRALDLHPDARGVLMQAVETSTGVENPLEDLAVVIRRHSCLWVVDAVTGLGSMRLDFDRWGMDAVIGASQKTWMLPPGLAMVWLSARAWKKAERTHRRPYYLDLVAHRDAQVSTGPRFTPIIPLVVGLHAVLDYIERIGGLDAMIRDTRARAEMARSRLTDLGFELFAREHPAAALTAVRVPPEWSGVEWVRYLRREYGVTVAGGQGPVKDKVFRINHLGYIDAEDLNALFEILAEAKRNFTSRIASGYNE